MVKLSLSPGWTDECNRFKWEILVVEGPDKSSANYLNDFDPNTSNDEGNDSNNDDGEENGDADKKDEE